MAFPKNQLFSEEDQKISQISFALSHPARLFIMQTLWETGPKYVLELERMMPLSQGSVSFHLNKLRLEGLVRVEEQRLFNRYSLDIDRVHETLNEYQSWYSQFEHDRNLVRNTKLGVTVQPGWEMSRLSERGSTAE